MTTGTTFGEVFDFFMTTVKDFRLDTLYLTSVVDFENYLSGFLIPAITEFEICDQSLAYSTSTFTETLTQKNINILVKLMKRRWLEKDINDYKQISLAVTDKDFKRYAESNLILAKQKMLILEREEISQAFTNYSLKNTTDWASWYSGVYFVP